MLKRIVLLALALCTVFTLCSCDRKDKRNIFFDAQTLARYSLEYIPVPNTDNSRLRSDTLYLNLSDEEFVKYIGDVSGYLLEREDVYNLCYKAGESFDADHIREDYCIPLFDPYVPSSADGSSVSFAFSYSPELGSHGLLTDPVRIEFIRKESTLSLTKFTYNTIMSFSFNSTITSYYDLCAFEHEWGETREYITPGSEEKLELRRCLRCDLEEHLCDPYTDDAVYKVTVKEGGELLAEPIVKRHKSGTLVEILVTRSEGMYPMLVANGVMIPVCTEEDGVISYRFLMPCAHVTVSVMEFNTWPPIIEEEQTEFALSELALWMADVDVADVASLTVTDDIPDASPMSFIPHATVSGEDAAALFALYRDTRFTDTKGDLPDVLGTLRTLTFTLVSGESYTLTLRGAIFETADGAYSASELPSIPDGATVTTSYSFASPDSAACSVYANDADNTHLGAIADIGALEFIPIGAEDVPDSDAIAVIKTGSRDLLVIADDVFCMIGDEMVMEYYRITNGTIYDFIDSEM